MLFVCPKCMQKLNIDEGARAVCPAGHSYDRSRHGYYNLLLSGSGGTHGDNRDMVLARRAFLDTGAYLPLADKLSELSVRYAASGGAVLEVGMGEGYYTERVAAALEREKISHRLMCFDISKDAARYAARRVPTASVAVASAYKMPVATDSVDLALNVFSPLALGELCRVIRAGGRFIMAIPNRRHLFGLKRELYREPYENEVAPDELTGFTLLERIELSYELKLSGESIMNLFMMTPYAYRTPSSAREHLSSLDSLVTEVEFIVFVYERNPS